MAPTDPDALRRDISRLKVFLAHVETQRNSRCIIIELQNNKGGTSYTHGQAGERRRRLKAKAKVGPHGVPIVKYPSTIAEEL